MKHETRDKTLAIKLKRGLFGAKNGKTPVYSNLRMSPEIDSTIVDIFKK